MSSRMKKREKSRMIEYAVAHGLRMEEEEEDSSNGMGKTGVSEELTLD